MLMAIGQSWCHRQMCRRCNGNQVIKVTAGDIAGNQVGGSLTASVDTVAPVITINNFAGDNRLNIQEATQAQTLSGTAVGAEAGQK